METLPDEVVLPDKKGLEPERCLNCGRDVEMLYCSNCGQSVRDVRVSIGSLVMDFLGDYFTFDSKLIRSMKPLFFKPGYLTVAFMQGKRVHFIPPLRMYIFCSILFFLTLSLISRPGTDDQQEKIPPSAYILAREQSLPQPLRDALTDFLALSERAEVEADLIEACAALGITMTAEMVVQATEKGEDWRPDPAIWEGLSEKNREDLVDELESFRKRLRRIEKRKDRGYFSQNSVIQTKGEEDKFDENSWYGPWLNRKLEERQERFNQLSSDETNRLMLNGFLNMLPKILFLLMPLFAFFLKLAYVRRDPLYIDHLIFAFHFHAFLFLYYCFLVLFNRLVGGDWTIAVLVFGIVFGSPIYLLVALKRVHGQGWFKTFLKFAFLMVLYFFSLIAVSVVSFLITMFGV